MKKISTKNNKLTVLLHNITKLAQTATLTLALSFFIAAPAMAQAPVPTLDNLHNQDIINPATQEKDDQGNPIEGTGTVYPESAYTLTEIENADPDNLPQNAITLYDKNDDGTVTPKYYLVNLKDSVKNIGSGDTTKYFEWSQNTDTGNLEFKEVSSPTEGKQTITVNYDSSSLQERINNTEDKSSETIIGSFVNKSTGSTSGSQYGGAIYNNGSSAKLGDINADFIGNYVSSTNKAATGGAIYNDGTIGNITGNFIGNHAHGGFSWGGVISNYGSAMLTPIIANITGNFIGNYVSTNGNIGGGVIYNNSGTIENITGDFIGNYALSLNGYVYGSVIMNRGTIGNIVGDFIGNYAFANNNEANGGAIYNDGGTIEDITGNFINNYVQGSTGSRGGAIFNNRAIGGIVNSSFIGNHATATSENGIAQGGAIYTNKNLNIIAKDGGQSIFRGNYVEDQNGKRQEAIYVEGQSTKLTLEATNKGSFIIDDKINGAEGYNLSLTGDSTGKVILNNDVINASISLDNTNLYLGR